MTFVRTRLLIERMESGDTATIILRGEEPVGNVPASVAELGHRVVEMGPLEDAGIAPALTAELADQPGDMCLRIIKT